MMNCDIEEQLDHQSQAHGFAQDTCEGILL